LVARGVPDKVFAGGQGVQSQSIQTTRSGWSFVETPTYPDGTQGGIYTSADGFQWQNASAGIVYPASPKPGLLSSGGRSSIAIDGDDVFMAANGRMFHHVPPGTNVVSGFVYGSDLQPLSNAIVRTVFGQWTVSRQDGSYSLTNVGSSLYPVTIYPVVSNVAFPPTALMISGAVSSINFTGATPVLTSIAISPPLGTVAGGMIALSATANDQFGQPLQPQPTIDWTAEDGVILANGLFVSPEGALSTTRIDARVGNISAFTSVTGFGSPLPYVSGLSTNRGPITGGTAVVLYGGNFSTNSIVLFGGLSATISSLNSTSITCVLPDMSHSATFVSGGLAPISVADATAGGTTVLNGFEFIPSGNQTFFASLVGATTAGQTQVSRVPGAVLPIVAASAPTGQVFYAWSGGGTGSFGSITNPSTVFTMPAHDVTIVATYKAVPSQPACPVPVISPSGGIFSPGTLVSITTAITNADIFYTLNGVAPTSPSTTPVPNSIRYTGPFVLPAGATVKAICSAPYRPDSGIASAVFTNNAIDVWRFQNFGTNILVAGNTADPDNDGQANLLEYALGGDPMSANSKGQLSAGLTNIAGLSYPILAFSRNTAATDAVLTVQWSSDLASWVDGASYSGPNGVSYSATMVEIDRSGSPLETIRIRSAYSTTNGSTQFLRLVVQPVP
jgi:hypothetical protein